MNTDLTQRCKGARDAVRLISEANEEGFLFTIEELIRLQSIVVRVGDKAYKIRVTEDFPETR